MVSRGTTTIPETLSEKRHCPVQALERDVAL
jgi:hypothetical protein